MAATAKAVPRFQRALPAAMPGRRRHQARVTRTFERAVRDPSEDAVQVPGVPQYPCPKGETGVASVMIRPALTRCL